MNKFQQAASVDPYLVENLSLLVTRLSRALLTASPGHQTAYNALDYLEVRGLSTDGSRTLRSPGPTDPEESKIHE